MCTEFPGLARDGRGPPRSLNQDGYWERIVDHAEAVGSICVNAAFSLNATLRPFSGAFATPPGGSGGL